MSLTEVLPSVQSLSRIDKLRLIQFLAQDLTQAETESLLQSGSSYPVWSPLQAFEAATALMRGLVRDQAIYCATHEPLSSPRRGGGM